MSDYIVRWKTYGTPSIIVPIDYEPIINPLWGIDPALGSSRSSCSTVAGTSVGSNSGWDDSIGAMLHCLGSGTCNPVRTRHVDSRDVSSRALT